MAPELEMSWMSVFWELAFMVSEHFIQVSKSGKLPTVLPNYKS